MKDRTQLLIRMGYHGSRFHGVHPQPGYQTVSTALFDRLEEASEGLPPKRLVFTSRTDAGVHARENFATCWFPGRRDPTPIIERLCEPRDDGLLDVRARAVSQDVFARTLSRGKQYRYQLEYDTEEECADAWCLPHSLDVGRMQQAAANLGGTHDFSSFRTPRCASKDPVKTLEPIELIIGDNSVALDLRGASFLRHMVRIIVGTLAEIGLGVRHPDTIPEIFAAKDRMAAGRTAPAHGLTLVKIFTDFEFD